MNHYIFQGGPEVEWLLSEEPFERFFWTANKHIRPGDVALIYLTAPLSRIIATVRIQADPFFNPRETSMFDNPFMDGKWCVEVGDSLYLGNHDELSMANLRRLFSTDWGWVRYPRGSTRIPVEIVSPLLELISPYLPTIQVESSIPK